MITSDRAQPATMFDPLATKPQVYRLRGQLHVIASTTLTLRSRRSDNYAWIAGEARYRRRRLTRTQGRYESRT